MSDILDARDELFRGQIKKVDEEAEAARQKDAVENFLLENQERVTKWYKENPGKMPPVFFIDGRVVWLNREQVRRLKRMKQKQRAELGLSNPLRTRAADHTAKISSLKTPQKEEGNEQTARTDSGAIGDPKENGNGPVG